jgi:8-oxo-dGTP pyrophosphatase MutT (NUDIX family)
LPGRIDYYNDPSAPKANSLVPSVNVVVTNEDEDVLLIQRSDNGNWAIPGGEAEYQMDRSMRLRVGHFLAGRHSPYLG